MFAITLIIIVKALSIIVLKCGVVGSSAWLIGVFATYAVKNTTAIMARVITTVKALLFTAFMMSITGAILFLSYLLWLAIDHI